MIGTVVEGKYTVRALLGEGGMAAVYRVEHNTLGTSHALKVLTLGRKSLRERLLNEGIVQATLDHPNAVAVRDVLNVDGSPALLMEFVDGPDLEAWIQSGVHSLADREAVFRGIVAAVSAAHERGLIHRDLKPANVLMARRGDAWVPKVCDFGIAKIADEEANRTTGSTRTGVAMGTPAFMAPEQIRDAKNVDHRADIFSLGCILYQLMTGVQPFRRPDIVELYNAITTGTYVPPRERVPDLPERIANTIRACLEVDRDQRLADCAALLGSLDAAPTIAPPPPPPFEPQTSATRPRRLPLLLLAAGLGILLVGGGIAAAISLSAAVYTLPTSGDNPASGSLCGGRAGTTVGFVKAGALFLKRSGQVWTLPRAMEVRADYPRAENEYASDGAVICTLPRGTRVSLRQAPIKSRGTWIPIEADAFEVPDAEPPPETQAP